MVIATATTLAAAQRTNPAFLPEKMRRRRPPTMQILVRTKIASKTGMPMG